MSYTSDQISSYDGLGAVRKTPGMYIGSTDIDGLHHLVYEVLDNSIDEAMGGYCDEISITIYEDGSILVEDNGRGIPVDDMDGEPAVNKIMTELHIGGKFENDAYEQSGGLHGVGVSVVNALSDSLEVKIKRDGHLWSQSFDVGEPEGIEKERSLDGDESTGTSIRFWPDGEIMEETEFQFETLNSRIRNLAYLNPGVEMQITDERTDIEENYRYDEGISAFVKHLNEARAPIHKEVLRFSGSEETDEGDSVEVEIAMQYTESTQSDGLISTFANNIKTTNGGSHETGFKTSLTRIINDYATRNNKFSDIEADRLDGSFIREGLTAVISVRHTDPQFEGQTKRKLGNTEVRGIVSRVLKEQFSSYLNEHPNNAESIVDKAIESYEADKAAEQAKELTRRKTATGSSTLPGKLSDCSKGTSPEDAELFIVEGDSAGGCFTRDTEIATVSDGSIRFDELVEGGNYRCYTMKDNGTITTEELKNPRVTKKDANLVKVKLSNGKSVKCTPDHEFMTKEHDFCEAQNLNTGDVLSAADISNQSSSLRNRNEMVQMMPQRVTFTVDSIQKLDDKQDVYDVEVPKTHNFALKSGVFVHNSAKQGRNPEKQAVLPLRGKIINVEKSRNRLDKILEHDQIQNLVTALGTGLNDEFDLDDLRYETITIFTDADVDGAHIQTLLLTFLYRHMRPLIENGHVYIAQPPLYRIKDGANTYDVMTEDEKDKIVNEKCDGNPTNIQRFKGLGEMNPQQLWDTTMNPENRVLSQVTIEDKDEAGRVINVLLGDKVKPRREFIKENAMDADFVDI